LALHTDVLKLRLELCWRGLVHAVQDMQAALAAGEVPGLQNLGKSFLSIDTEGRVLRFESAAKFLAPGAQARAIAPC
jgi:hypothetical protein